MKTIIIAPDSFKGTLSSVEVCTVISQVLKKKYNNANIISIPIADGGEGTVDAFLYALGGKKIYCKANSPLMNETEAYYAILPDGTAVIEMAQASGITKESENKAILSSTYGTGELILHALSQGATDFIIGLGGSATTDAGIGALACLGAVFYDKNGKSVPLCGNGLVLIDNIDISMLDKRLRHCHFTLLCDVKNPLYGKNGAAFVFASQKGANKEQISFLDEGLKNIANVTKKLLKKDYSLCEGSGAAGGLAFGLTAFLGAKIKNGGECILEVTEFHKKCENADIVITGEGKMDNQSLMGKIPFCVASHCKNKPVIAIVGSNHLDKNTALLHGINQIIETNPKHLPFEEIRHCAKQMLIEAVETIII